MEIIYRENINLEKVSIYDERFKQVMKQHTDFGYKTEYLSDYYKRLEDKESKFNLSKDNYIKYLVDNQEKLGLIKTTRWCRWCTRDFVEVITFTSIFDFKSINYCTECKIDIKNKGDYFNGK